MPVVSSNVLIILRGWSVIVVLIAAHVVLGLCQQDVKLPSSMADVGELGTTHQR